MVVGSLVKESGDLGATAEESWNERTMRRRQLSLGARERMGAACAPGEKTWGGEETMEAAPLLALDTGNSLPDEGALWKSAVRHVWKWSE